MILGDYFEQSCVFVNVVEVVCERNQFKWFKTLKIKKVQKQEIIFVKIVCFLFGDKNWTTISNSESPNLRILNFFNFVLFLRVTIWKEKRQSGLFRIATSQKKSNNNLVKKVTFGHLNKGLQDGKNVQK